MQRISSLAVGREVGSLAGLCALRSGSTCRKQPRNHRQQRWTYAAAARPFSAEVGRMSARRKVVFAGDGRRMFGSEPPGSSGSRPAVSVVGIPDPITWIRCKVIMYLIELYFEIDLNSEEFNRGIKQAVVHVSSQMSNGRFHELKGIVSDETRAYVEQKCKSLSAAQRRQLSVQIDDIIFLLPEDVSVVFDQYGRKFCFVVMRFWMLSSHEGPDDPEGTKIFKVTSSDADGPQMKVATAVYEFHRELTRGASPEWSVTTVWHWSFTEQQKRDV
ncbi:m-AAA protease-interacting protein 1, mitochondrial [Gouania willdenowi]|uniref:m-AAA protease-interacting protein 1, mitochondrial n=1 Tax=Gouania willdenowi TaxID=441366 RepID=UPI0010549E8C|nr:m-AAA protease-interacting protein 1, mitochondrial-like [Gouania willdenowi]